MCRACMYSAAWMSRKIANISAGASRTSSTELLPRSCGHGRAARRPSAGCVVAGERRGIGRSAAGRRGVGGDVLGLGLELVVDDGADGDGDGRADGGEDDPLHGVSSFAVAAAADPVAGGVIQREAE